MQPPHAAYEQISKGITPEGCRELHSVQIGRTPANAGEVFNTTTCSEYECPVLVRLMALRSHGKRGTSPAAGHQLGASGTARDPPPPAASCCLPGGAPGAVSTHCLLFARVLSPSHCRCAFPRQQAAATLVRAAVAPVLGAAVAPRNVRTQAAFSQIEAPACIMITVLLPCRHSGGCGSAGGRMLSRRGPPACCCFRLPLGPQACLQLP